MCVLFVKQKTAYEMRISDWSSDVCSSDLSQSCFATEARDELVGLDKTGDIGGSSSSEYRPLASDLSSQSRVQNAFLHPRVHHTFQFDSRQCDETEDDQIWNEREAHDDRSSSEGLRDRKSVGKGKSGAVREDRGGGGNNKKK